MKKTVVLASLFACSLLMAIKTESKAQDLNQNPVPVENLSASTSTSPVILSNQFLNQSQLQRSLDLSVPDFRRRGRAGKGLIIAGSVTAGVGLVGIVWGALTAAIASTSEDDPEFSSGARKVSNVLLITGGAMEVAGITMIVLGVTQNRYSLNIGPSRVSFCYNF